MATESYDKKKVLGVLKELSNSMTRAEGERDYQKEAIKSASEDAGIEKKIFRKLARTYHKQNFTEEQQDSEAFLSLYESVVQPTA